MPHSRARRFLAVATLIVGVGATLARPATADGPAPRLSVVNPPGAQVGTTVEVQVSGTGLEGITALRCDEPRIRATAKGGGRFTLQIPAEVPPGLYDLRALGPNGLSAPRGFFVSPRETLAEVEPNGIDAPGQAVKLDLSLCGRVEPAGDVDVFRVQARLGQRIVIECWAERLDSRLRAVLELVDERGRRVASNRSRSGLDPLIDFRAPADGEYTVRVFDLTYGGGSEYAYRLDIDTGPRPEFAWPTVVESGKPTRVTLFGRNLATDGDSVGLPELDRVEFEVRPPVPGTSPLLRLFARPSRFSVDEFPVDLPGAPAPVLLGTTDVPVVLDEDANHGPESAQSLAWPCEVSGRLEAAGERDWYRLHAQRGEVLWFELMGERIGSPVDLDLVLLDARDRRERLHLTDRSEDPKVGAVATGHADPAGRWVAPGTGDYLILVRDLIGSAGPDPRRLYRLSVRREEADFQLLAIPAGGVETGGWNVPRGGRARLDLVALRRRGMSQPIRVTASGLPEGYECPEVWLGPEVDRVPVIVTASRSASPEPGEWTFTGRADLGGVEITREARGATVLWTGPPSASARLAGRMVAALGPEASCLVTATPGRTAVSQGSVVDVQVDLDVAGDWQAGPVALTAIGSPAEGGGRSSPEPGDPSRLWFSVRVPERLPPGPYTFAIRAETTLTAPPEKPGAPPRKQTVAVDSNAVTIQVLPGAFDLAVDPGTPRTIRRGEVIVLRYRALRRNGFIGKIHTELHAPEGVSGLRARGVTFVGQTETGELQIIASDDAPLGRQPTLRLEAVGTVEDEPIHHGGCFVDLEITR